VTDWVDALIEGSREARDSLQSEESRPADPWADVPPDYYGRHFRPEFQAFRPYPVTQPDYYWTGFLFAGGCHARRVTCVDDCGALDSPESLDEYHDAHDHWRDHLMGPYSVCSHG